MTSSLNDSQEILALRLQTIRNLLDGSGRAWAFLREPATVRQDLLSGTDIDIWIDQRAIRHVFREFLHNGWYLAGGRSIGYLGSDSFNATLRFRGQDPEWPVVEVFCGALRWGPVIYWRESMVISEVNQDGDFPVIEGATLLSVLLNRTVLRGGEIDDRLERARQHLASISEQTVNKWKTQTRLLCGIGTDILLLKVLQKEPAGWGYRALYLAQASLTLSWKLQVLGAFLRKHCYRLRRLLLTGVTCELVGTDGTGKSTLSKDVTAELQKAGIEVREQYWGRTRGNTAPVTALRGLVLKLLGKDTETDAQGTDRGRPVAKAGFFYRLVTSVGALIFLVEYWFRYLFRLLPNLPMPVIILLDRGPTDFAVMNNTFALTRQLYRFSPPLTLRLFIRVPPQVIHDRKQERSLEEIAEQQSIYRQVYLSARERKLVSAVNTTGNRELNTRLVCALLRSTLQCQQGSLDRRLLALACEAIATDTQD